MELSTITMERAQARERFLEYRDAVRQRFTAEDAEIMRGYRALSQGMQLVELSKSIAAGGVFEHNGLPRIACATASHQWVWCSRTSTGRVSFLPESEWSLAHNRVKDCFRFTHGTLEHCAEPSSPSHLPSYWNGRFRAMVPIVPPALRPAHSLNGYVTLFEVEEWAIDPSAPRDPALLKHLGGDLYAVVAIWDLSDLERAVLSRRNG